jgi:pimeloyl-ACP methyl ester carboxylesterase
MIPHIQTKLIPNAGHALNLHQPGMVNEQILAFLQAEAVS